MPIVGPPTNYVTVEEVRDAGPLDLTDTTKFPDADVLRAIDWFETRFEDYTAVAWLPRTSTAAVDGTGTSTLLLPRYPVLSVQSVRVYTKARTTYTDYTSDDLANVIVPNGDEDDENDGELDRFDCSHWPWGRQNIVITYTHGHSAPPSDVIDACIVAVRQKLLDDKSGGRANRQFSVATEAGVARSSLPGLKTPFGIPSVDAIANYRRKSRAPVIA